jgi:hypothetical protein
MDAFRKLTTTVAAAAVLAMAVAVGPVAAVEEEPAPAPTAEDEGGRIVLVEEPRDILALLLLGGLLTAGGIGLANARRQLKGDRPQATGEFRWR